MKRVAQIRLASCLATECKMASDRLLALQEELGAALHGDRMTADLVSSLQSLDLVQQTIADVSRILDVVAIHRDDQTDDIWLEILAAVEQISLRARIDLSVQRSGQAAPCDLSLGGSGEEIW
ncbi:MAG: hypothetical protein WBA67_15280 [Jannaschia sp.]